MSFWAPLVFIVLFNCRMVTGEQEPDTGNPTIAGQLSELKTMLSGLLAERENDMQNLLEQFSRHRAIMEHMQARLVERDRLLQESVQEIMYNTINSTSMTRSNLQKLVQEMVPTDLQQRFMLDEPEDLPADCADLQASGQDSSGVYKIVLPQSGRETQVYCDMSTDGGGWLVFQRRITGEEDFYKDYASYVNGFGNPESDYWLGLDALHSITSVKEYEMRVDMTTNLAGLHGFAHYSSVRLDGPEDGYALILGAYTGGNAGDSLSSHNGQAFSTKDRDQDGSQMSCAQTYHGGWWYHSTSCLDSNLNGMATDKRIMSPRYMVWRTYQRWRPLGTTAMKIRPMRD